MALNFSDITFSYLNKYRTHGNGYAKYHLRIKVIAQCLI